MADKEHKDFFPFSDSKYRTLKWVSNGAWPILLTLAAAIFIALNLYGIMDAELGLLINAVLAAVGIALSGLVSYSAKIYLEEKALKEAGENALLAGVKAEGTD